jgi:predicted acetyltransferase
VTASIRAVEPGEVRAFVESAMVPFLAGDADDCERRWRPMLDHAQAWAVDDGGRFAGNGATLRLELTLPGDPPPLTPVAGVTFVGVHPTHRRQGWLRRMMATMLADAVERGEPLAALYASEASIYGRFGFGVATRAARASVDAGRSGFAAAAPAVEVRLLPAADAQPAMEAVFDRARRRQVGQVSRPPGIWAANMVPPVEKVSEFHAVADGGYAVYRAERSDPQGGRDRLDVVDLCAEDRAVEAALWRFLLDVDLVKQVDAWVRPGGDEPLVHRLADPRALRTTAVIDFLWLRILDVASVLGCRGYRHPGRLVLDVAPAADGLGDGPVADPAAGRWVLDADPSGASARPARPGEDPDLRLGVAELSALVAGGAASTLAAAGRVVEARPGALAAADSVFGWRPAPFCTTDF